MEAMNSVGSKPNASDLSDYFIIRKISRLLRANENSSRKSKNARTFLGILLARQKTCDYAEISKELKEEIGNEGFKRLLNVDGKVTLTFVIDISGSMKLVIPKVKQIALSIAEYKSIKHVDYVLSTFSDDSKGTKLLGNVQNFDNLENFIEALDDMLSVRDYFKEKTGDCPEPAYAGIIKAITVGSPQRGSPMYVFTDAPPKPFGEFTEDNAIYHAQKNKIPITFFVSNSYCSRRARHYYRNITEATGGLAFGFRIRWSTRKLKRMIKGSLDGTSIIASKRSKRRQKSKRGIRIDAKSFYIDDIAHEGTIEVEAKGTMIHLFNPIGRQILPERKSRKRLSWTILRPLRGKWTFISTARSLKFGVKSQSQLDITLDWKFMRKGSIIDHPII
ncbi:uncharacterized protein LOC110248554, partial [Exaiptasia diaphana]|uniref:Hemicentin-1-like von Willebrand factor A domain-containing protein n=1 Tax=Exaiptasia diaphana TaxID=2652724 RepID=A0A913YTI3_EXADI